MRKELRKQPRTLLDENWEDALKGIAQGAKAFQKFAVPATDFEKKVQQFVNSPAGKLEKRLVDLANSPIAKQWVDMAKNIMAADMRAQRLSDVIHSATSVGDIQEAIDSEPVGAFTLLALVTLERNKEASELEKRITEQNRVAKSEQGRELAKILHAKSPHAQVKPEIIKFYEEHAAETKTDGRPRFKTKASFVREVLKKHADTVTDPDTIARWITESDIKVPHWRTRATATNN